MPERPQHHDEYGRAHELMALMVEHSQRPAEGNEDFVRELSAALEDGSLSLETIADPEYPDRKLLVAHCGDPEGEQVLTTISHSDVVGVEGQDWHTSPWELHERDGVWVGRGTCDTHGSGVSMLLAAERPEVRERLQAAGAKVSMVFTYDEESTSPEFSMRGARLAAGALEVPPVATSRYYISGEPTEVDGRSIAMRGHKGRFLAHFTINVDHAGHVSDLVQNAFTAGIETVKNLEVWGNVLTYGSADIEEDNIFKPPHTTVQVSAVDVKHGDFSTTPARARFTVDMRTVPEVHDLRVLEIKDLLTRGPWEEGVEVRLDVVKDAEGSMTDLNSPIVGLAEELTGHPARAFNGGDEGRIMRRAGKEGIAIGPGELAHAHQPNEEVAINSVFSMADCYAQFFIRAIALPRSQAE